MTRTVGESNEHRGPARWPPDLNDLVGWVVCLACVSPLVRSRKVDLWVVLLVAILLAYNATEPKLREVGRLIKEVWRARRHPPDG